MSVIGRLDGQVEEVIIKPVGRRRAPDAADAPEIASEIPTTTRDEPLETPRDRRPETPREDGELPVWLL